ncbi:hypothetical protein [Motilimonas sp. KMU-193]|uniref:hypothetical protein n=1 Tax=Motilimonas sp. KMU-193 TaxID=3388668 RepID=UPI00396B0247
MLDQDIKTLYSGNIAIEYGQFYIDIPELDDEDDYLDPEVAFKDQQNGICGASQSGKLFFVTGIQNGTASVEIKLYSSEPTIDDAFEEIVEVSFKRNKTPVALCEWGCEEIYPIDLPEGNYGVRYCIIAMGADYGDDDDWEAPVKGQKHLIQIWPSEPTMDKIIKSTSDTASYWHKEWGGQ